MHINNTAFVQFSFVVENLLERPQNLEAHLDVLGLIQVIHHCTYVYLVAHGLFCGNDAEQLQYQTRAILTSIFIAVFFDICTSLCILPHGTVHNTK